jgi:sigma-54 dependent transcriptional regulator, acetoin dehydrogenase operon transcriptional activator AcoR
MHNALTRHIDNVIAIGSGGLRDGDPESVFYRSWARCMTQHGLDPARPTPARILPSDLVRVHQQRMDGFLRVARSGMEELYRRVADLGYMVLLTDADGITVDYIGNPSTEPQLKAAGLYLGADWSEAHAGTCGVGTSIIERKAITCHQADHFDATHIALTCTSSPLFAPDGDLLGVLDISALHSPEARESQHLALHLASMYTQMIEDSNFLRSFGKHWVLRLGHACGLVEVSGEVMFAFDEDGVIVGANTGARRRFGGVGPGAVGDALLVGRSLMDLLDLGFDGLWAIARGQVAVEVAGLYPHQNQRFYPAVIAPRTRAGSAVRIAAPRLPAPASASERPGALDRLAGDDGAMQRLIDQAKRLVDRKVSLLIQGETGSGKEVLAKALHDHSSRAHKPFIAVNCASIPESLIESELFGYTPGSFTGGKSKGMKGLIAQSDGGTLFLDEIGDMPLHLQTRFLRVLSESEVVPLGAEQPIAVNLNVIAATHRDLRGCIEHGSFREDLYYRLSGATLHLPALRERRDIGYLIQTIFDEEAGRVGLATQLDREALALMAGHHWPGNIRELRNALRYALALAGDRPVSPDDLPVEVVRGSRPSAAFEALDATYAALDLDVDADRLLQVLRKCKWSITSTAQELDVCRATVYRQMKRYRITPPNQL